MKNNTEKIKGNLVMMMEMLTNLHPGLSQTWNLGASPPNNARTHDVHPFSPVMVMKPLPHSIYQPGESSQSWQGP